MTLVRPPIEERVRASKRTIAQREADERLLQRHYAVAFGTESGKAVLADLLRKCGVLGPSLNPTVEGARLIGMYLIDQLTRDPADHVKFQLSSNVEHLVYERDRTEAG